MNRTRTIIAAAFGLVLLLVVIAIARGPKSEPDAPKFVPAASQPAGPFGRVVFYPYLDFPFRDGKVWIFTVLNRTNRHMFYYDLDRKLVLGEFIFDGPVFFNQDETKLFCYGPDSPAVSLKAKLAALLSRFTAGKLNVPTYQIETFWMLDVQHNSARRVGHLSQTPGTSSTWHQAPGFRYGYNVPNNREEGAAFFLCDFLTDAFTKIRFAGEPKGWWDEHDILIKDPTSGYLLFDVATRKTSTLFTVGTIAASLKDMGIPDNPFEVNTDFNWNGSNYDVYLSGKLGAFPFTNTTFLIKLERPAPALKLLYREFQFAWIGHLDASATHYLYDGESGTPGAGGNGGVFLRNLTNGTVRTLVPPDNSGQYAQSRFYGDSVIYSTNRTWWRIDLNGSNNVPVFFPPDK